MDQVKQLLRLAQAEDTVELGASHIVRQRELVVELECLGFYPSQANELLVLFKEMQALHIATRDRLLRELGDEAQNVTGGPYVQKWADPGSASQ
jgi:hypothetical protein